PPAATEREILEYRLDRALRGQGVVSLDSICYLDAWRKPAIHRMIQGRLNRNELVPVALQGAEKIEHWARPETLEAQLPSAEGPVHILSPFDPLIHQRKRVALFF